MFLIIRRGFSCLPLTQFEKKLLVKISFTIQHAVFVEFLLSHAHALTGILLSLSIICDAHMYGYQCSNGTVVDILSAAEEHICLHFSSPLLLIRHHAALHMAITATKRPHVLI